LYSELKESWALRYIRRENQTQKDRQTINIYRYTIDNKLAWTRLFDLTVPCIQGLPASLDSSSVVAIVWLECGSSTVCPGDAGMSYRVIYLIAQLIIYISSMDASLKSYKGNNYYI